MRRDSVRLFYDNILYQTEASFSHRELAVYHRRELYQILISSHELTDVRVT